MGRFDRGQNIPDRDTQSPQRAHREDMQATHEALQILKREVKKGGSENTHRIPLLEKEAKSLASTYQEKVGKTLPKKYNNYGKGHDMGHHGEGKEFGNHKD